MPLTIEPVVVGAFYVNCYIVSSSDSAQTLLIDPGDEPDRIEQLLQKRGLPIPTFVLLTHGHVDHIGAARHFVDQGAQLFLHPDELALYSSTDNEVLPWMPARANLPHPLTTLPDGLPWTIRVLHTPGHSPGGVCYLFEGHDVLFTGDTLFQGNVGRTDLPASEPEALLKAIRQKLLVLPDETRVFPGHGPQTTIGEERDTNPFL